MWLEQLFPGSERCSLRRGSSVCLPMACLVDTLADGRAFELEPRVPSWPLWGCSGHMTKGTAGLNPDDTPRKLSSSPAPRNWGLRPEEVRIKPKAKAGASPSEATKAMLGASFLTPSSIRLVGDSWRKKTVNSGFRTLELEGGYMAKWAENEGMLHHPLTPIGIREPGILPPWFLPFRSQGLAWSLHTGSSWGPSPSSLPPVGRNGRAQTCDMCTFSKEEKSTRLGLGLASGGRADPVSQQTASASRIWFT